jgi:flagellin-like protein
MRKLLKSKKALSPVVAAIILIAVTVAVSIAVAAWMGSMTFTFMETEELKITSVDFDTTLNTLSVNVRNTGTSDVVIISGTINNEDGSLAGDVTIEAGTPTGADEITLSATDLVDGTTYIVELLSSKGNTFAWTGIA